MDPAGTARGIVPVVGDDGIIRTDGTTILGADDKAGLAGCLELLRLLREHPDWSHPTIEFVSTVGEERGLVGSRHLDVSRLHATHGFVLDTAGVMGSVTYWSPTSVYLTITFHGRKAHAGVEPEKGVSAVQAAAEAVAGMPLGRIDEETVANIGTVRGGEARNIVPDTVVLEGMARSHDQDKLDRQLAAMRLACERAAEERGATVDVVAEEIYRTYRISEDARPYREAARAIRSLGLDVSPRKSGGGTDGNYFNAKGIPCVALPTGMVDEHATSEHIAIDDLVLACRVLVAIVTQPDEGAEPP
jgi:tripeptide aminopeptidase